MEEILIVDVMPLYLTESLGPSLEPCSHGFILLDLEDCEDGVDRDFGQYNKVVRCIENTLVSCIKTEYFGYTLYYVNLYDVNKFTETLMKKVGGAVTGNLTCWSKKGTHSGYDDLKLLQTVSLSDVDFENLKYTYNIKNKSKKKITQFHHLHVRLKDLYTNKISVELKGAEAYLARLLDEFNDIESCHVTFLVYYSALPVDEKQLFINLIRSYGEISRLWLKKEGVNAKQAQNCCKYDLSKLFELNVLENRVDEEVDWAKEKLNRTKLKAVPVSYGSVLNLAAKLFANAKSQGARPMKMSWRDYWDQRAVTMPTGAVHSRYDEDDILIRKLPRGARNKKGFASALPDYEQSQFLNRHPEITAHVSTKYEWGKTRALYGCDFTSHVNADFGLMGCEDTFPNNILTGSRATPNEVKKEMDLMNGVPLCYDYDDFNSQHTISSMKAVIDAWLMVYNELLTKEQHEAVIWTRNSIDCMIVKNSYTEDKYQATGTLFSGWRLTSFINSILNAVYLDIAGIDECCYKSVHNGDDVFSSAKSVGHSLSLIDRAAVLGARAQKTKMNIGTIAEFLRMDIKARKTTMTQYLTRGCATFVHSRIELEAPYSLRNLVSAYYTRYSELISRGAIVVDIRKCYRKQLYFSARLFEVDKDIINLLIETDLSAGGIRKNGTISNYRLVEVEQDRLEGRIKDIKTLTHKGISAYTSFLKRKFCDIKDAFSLRAVERNIMQMYNVYKKTVVREDCELHNITTEKALKGAWSNLEGMTALHKVRMGISDIILAITAVDPALSSVLKNSGNPVKWLRILL